MKWHATYLTATLVGMMSLTGCNQSNQAASNTDTNPKTPASSAATPTPATNTTGGKNYKVLIDPQYPPYGSLNEKGKPVGFDIDIIEAIAKQQGLNITLVPAPWETTLDKISKGQYDIAISAIAPSDITNSPYANKVTQSYAYNYGSDAIASIDPVMDTFDQLKTIKVATLSDTGYVNDLKTLQGGTSNLVESKSFFLALQALNRKEVGAVLGDKGILTHLASKFPDTKFTIAGKGKYFERHYPMTIVLKNGDADLATSVNQGIEAIVKDGTYSKIYEKWFHAKPTIMPKPVPIPADDSRFVYTSSVAQP